MKSFAYVVSLFLLTSAMSFAQTDSTVSTKTPEMYIAGGSALPSLPYPFHDFWGPGFSISAGYGYRLTPGPIGYATLYGSLEYSHFFFDQDGFLEERGLNPSGVTVTGKGTYAVTAMVLLKGTIVKDLSSIGPYFIIGLGAMSVTSGEVSTSGSDSRLRPKQTKTGAAWEAGAGVDFPVNERLRAFLEAKFYMGFTSSPGRQYYPMQAGIRFTP